MVTRKRGFIFHWLYLERRELDVDERQQIEEALNTVYKSIIFPLLFFETLDQDFVSSGFDPEYWKTKLT